ncbi:hypothetical protein DM02DRAFT_662747 [Periconia macrospinosa]|uniref:Integral membrane protein-like protein n=1 Tax=Periconia macrospinosa TaxID=97972 RepID=A0A2V1D3Q0_9PLEO|nr:hypothetical protein DM02DRAFT_662747 [Periconia macrospinosa]
MLKEDGEHKRVAEEEVRVRNWWNIFRKWFTDCITMGALLHQSMFLILRGIMKGKTIALIVQNPRNELFGLIFDSYTVWPSANFFPTTYFPIEQRIISLSFCGLLWNIYLSLVAARL